jgi:hypothetical protein
MESANLAQVRPSYPIISIVGYLVCGVICFFITDTPDDFEDAQPRTKGEMMKSIPNSLHPSLHPSLMPPYRRS